MCQALTLNRRDHGRTWHRGLVWGTGLGAVNLPICSKSFTMLIDIARQVSCWFNLNLNCIYD